MQKVVPARNEKRLELLTLRERKFVDALFFTTPLFNGAESARVAGFSKASCQVQAVELLTKYNVKMAIEARPQEKNIAKRLECALLIS